jgi:glutamyl-tRNA synthetase
VDFLFLPEPPADAAAWDGVMAGPGAPAILADARDTFRAVPWERTAIEEAVKSLAERHGMKVAKAQAPIRVAVTGRTRGLPLWDSLVVLGRPSTVARIDDALSRLAVPAPPAG